MNPFTFFLVLFLIIGLIYYLYEYWVYPVIDMAQKERFLSELRRTIKTPKSEAVDEKQ